MGQKTNPISLRLQKTNKFFSSNWYSKMFYSEIFKEEISLQEYINNVYTLLNFSRPLFFFNRNKNHKNCYLFFSSAEENRKNFLKFFRIKKKNLFLPQSKERKNQITKSLRKKFFIGSIFEKVRNFGYSAGYFFPSIPEIFLKKKNLDFGYNQSKKTKIFGFLNNTPPKIKFFYSLVNNRKFSRQTGQYWNKLAQNKFNRILEPSQQIKNDDVVAISKIFCKRLWVSKNLSRSNFTNSYSEQQLVQNKRGQKQKNYNKNFFFKKLFLVPHLRLYLASEPLVGRGKGSGT